MRFKFILFLFFTTGLSACSSGGGNPCTNYYVSTSGSDSASGDAANPFLTLEHARDVIRADPTSGGQCVNVNIADGTYRLTSPLVLTPEDSGVSGSDVIYKAMSGAHPVISGAKQITGWTLSDPVLNIWQAQTSVTTSTMPRQLYVNGTRATRARTVDYPNYYTPTSTGYTYLYIIGTDPQIPPTWNNPTAVEAVTATQWKMMRCPIASIAGASVVTMQTPCWTNANVFPSPWNFHLLNWWENAYEFLDQPGEWYLNPVSKILYYIPQAGENMSTADVELPVLETLIEGVGTLEAPIQYVRFEGLTFSYATWLDPNSSDGYALDQSGFHLIGPNHTANTIGHDPNDVRTPGNVSFIYARNISFVNNIFQHLGAVGLDFQTGSQSNVIQDNTFNDISSAAIQMGGIAEEDHHPTYAAQLTQNNQISNNFIQYIGQEFWDAPGIYIGFTTRSTVDHNTIQHVPWSGIAIGWGWGLLDPGGFAGLPNGTPYEWGYIGSPSAAHQNQITNNLIDSFLEKLWDGGAIYSTGFQGVSMGDGQLIAWNVAQNKPATAGGNTFYTDGGSRYITLRENVSLNNPTGYLDFGPCLKDSSFAVLCLTTDIVTYGADMGGCIPYGDLSFTTNYLGNTLTFYDICSNPLFPDYPVDINFVNNVKVTSSSGVPTSIIDSAGQQ